MLFVLSAPSGTGKTTVAEKLLEVCPRLRRIVTVTTRPKREGEIEGKDYIFMNQEDFKEKIKEGYFLEYAEVYGNYYGTPRDQVIKNEKEGFDSLLVIDIQGAKSVKASYKDCTLIFLMPPSLEELRRRLLSRGYGKENLEKRMEKAEEEIACAKFFDYIVVNEFIDKTVEALHNIIVSQRYRRDLLLKENSLLNEELLKIIQERECPPFQGM